VSKDVAKTGQFILASASPRRKELLESVGLSFIIDPSNADETSLPEESPLDYVRRIAAEKAREVANRHHSNGDQRPVFAADTFVVVDRDIIGKPRDRAAAKRMLQLLSNRVHQVFTGFCIIGPQGDEKQGAVSTDVRFKALHPQEIQAYLLTNEWHDKAGAYAVQGRAAYMVKEISGSYTNVVGLPLCEVIEALQEIISFFDTP